MTSARLAHRDGQPKLGIRGHDVEEFLGVVKRYGVGDPGGALAQLAGLARGTPEVTGQRSLALVEPACSRQLRKTGGIRNGSSQDPAKSSIVQALACFDTPRRWPTT
jgi:hypothetical protein